MARCALWFIPARRDFARKGARRAALVSAHALTQHAPDVDEGPAAVGMREVRGAWAARLPGDPGALFVELLAMPQSELLSLLSLLSLLAVCVGYTVSAIASQESEIPAAMLAQAVNLDMHDWWTPTAAGYFDHVSKAKALEAVQVFAPSEVSRLAKLKKGQIASEAERLAVGSGWVPVMFSKPAAVLADERTRAEAEGVEVEDSAEMHVTA